MPPIWEVQLAVGAGLALLALGMVALFFGLSWRRQLRAAETELTRARTLRGGDEIYRALFENTQYGLCHCRLVVGPDGRDDWQFIKLNPAFRTVTGLGDVVGQRISEVLPGRYGDNPQWGEAVARVVQTGQAMRCEHHAAALDQYFSFAICRVAQGEFVAVIEDITERRQAEMELRNLSLAVAQSSASIVITDAAGCIEYMNPAFSTVSGYSVEEAMGQNPSILKSGRTPPETYADLWRSLAEGRMWRGEFINRRKDGTDYVEQAIISPVRDAAGRVSHYVAVKEDVTERIQAAARLRASEERLRLAQDAAELGSYDHDLLTGTIQCDARTRELWGVGADEPMTDASFAAAVHPEDRAAREAALAAALDPIGSGKYRAEFRVIGRADSRQRNIASTGQVFLEGGRPVRFIGTVLDITERKRLARESQERRGEMAALLQQQVAAQTAAAIAHELNQPLVAISAYGEVASRALLNGAANPETLARAIKGSVEQAQRAGRTLHQLIGLLHKGEMAAVPLDINELVTEAIAMSSEDGYEFQPLLDLEPGLPAVLGNRLQLQKVLVNLLHNGVEAMRENGAQTAAIAISVHNLAGEPMVRVTVRDYGPGLDAETARRVFEPFYTTKPNGLGLGLAISRALIEAHGGRLWLDPEGGGAGASFHFSLPIADE